jgi:structural maintenance of chromosomes protein 6
LVRHTKQEYDLRIAAQRIEDQTEELRDLLEKDSVGDGRLDALRESLRETEEEMHLHQGSYADGLNALNSIMEKLGATERELATKNSGIDALSAQVKTAESERARVLNERRKALEDKNTAIKRVDDMKQEKTRIEHKREQLVNRILDYSEKASMVSPRVAIDKGETTNSLDKKLDRLHKDLQRFDEQ